MNTINFTFPKMFWWFLQIFKWIFRHSGLTEVKSLRRYLRTLNRDTITRYSRALHKPILIQGHKMYLTGEHVLFSMDLVADKFEPETTQLWKEIVKENMTVLDIGAHVGYFSLLAARLVGSQGKVYAFEAEPSTYEVLQKNIYLNHYGNIESFPVAVSNQSGTIKLYFGSRRSSDVTRWNRIYQSNQQEGGTEITATTIDSFLSARGSPTIDAIKMDIDGSEILALQGMKKLLSQNKAPKIIVEFYPLALQSCGFAPLDLPNMLFDLGYQVLVLKDYVEDRAAVIEILENPRNDKFVLLLEKPDFLAAVNDQEAINLFCEKQ